MSALEVWYRCEHAVLWTRCHGRLEIVVGVHGMHGLGVLVAGSLMAFKVIVIIAEC